LYHTYFKENSYFALVSLLQCKRTVKYGNV